MSEATLMQGDCLERMKGMNDCVIDLTVTSPPYDNLRTYNQDDWSWGEGDWKPIIRELYRVTAEGGVVVWIVGDATVNGSETGSSFKQALYAMECGFRLHDTMIWNKGAFSAVGALQTRYAPVFEYMVVLSKGRPKAFNPIKDKPNKHAGQVMTGNIRQSDGSTRRMCGDGVKLIAQNGQRHNVWMMPAKKSRQDTSHPAQFPESLAHDHIVSWSNEGDLVLDPFLGSGTTGVASINTNRNFIGIEIDPDYFSFAESRIDKAKGEQG
jgi:site-specific DNA-methyltransferase (adenine-specific)